MATMTEKITFATCKKCGHEPYVDFIPRPRDIRGWYAECQCGIPIYGKTYRECRSNWNENESWFDKRAIRDVLRERRRQNEGWGEQNHDPQTWLSVLVEEVGEMAKEANDLHFWAANGGGRDDIRARLYTEAVQTAAVALAIVECLLRGKWRWPEQCRERTELAEILRGLKLRGVITDADIERLEQSGWSPRPWG